MRTVCIVLQNPLSLWYDVRWQDVGVLITDLYSNPLISSKYLPYWVNWSRSPWGHPTSGYETSESLVVGISEKSKGGSPCGPIGTNTWRNWIWRVKGESRSQPTTSCNTRRRSTTILTTTWCRRPSPPFSWRDGWSSVWRVSKGNHLTLKHPYMALSTRSYWISSWRRMIIWWKPSPSLG